MSITIEQLSEQLERAVSQRDQYFGLYQQTIGAIQLIQEQIKLITIADTVMQEENALEDKTNEEVQP